jgi:hypothetical protein
MFGKTGAASRAGIGAYPDDADGQPEDPMGVASAGGRRSSGESARGSGGRWQAYAGVSVARRGVRLRGTGTASGTGATGRDAPESPAVGTAGAAVAAEGVAGALLAGEPFPAVADGAALGTAAGTEELGL